MTWTAPVSPVSGTIITVAWATANVVQPSNWLRLMTGNADPPGSSYVVVSDSATGTTWGKVRADAIADGAIIPSKFDRPYLALSGGTMSGALSLLTGVPIVLGGGGQLFDGPTSTVIYSRNDEFNVNDHANTVNYLKVNAAVFTYKSQSVIHSGNIGSQSVLNAVTATHAPLGITFSGGGQILDGPGSTVIYSRSDEFNVNDHANTANYLKVNNSAFTYKGQGVVHSGNIGSQAVLSATNATNATNAPTGITFANGGKIRDSGGGTLISADSGIFFVNNEADSVNLLTVTVATCTWMGNAVIHSGNIGSQDVASVGGRVPTVTPGPGRIPISDASGTLNSWITGSAGTVPSGLIAAFATAAAIASGWTRYTAADGRLLIGAGTSLSVAWAEATNYGTSWSHDHVSTGLTASSTFTGTGATIAASGSTNQANVTTPATAFSLGGHTHAYTPAGSVGTTISGNIGDTSWQPAMRGVVWAQKT